MSKYGDRIKYITTKKLGLPADVTLNLPRIIIVGFYQIYIENYNEIVKFTEEYLLLNIGDKYLKITGSNLKISSIIPEEIFVEGLIKKIDYLNKEELF